MTTTFGSGIYAIQRKDSDELYIGSAVNIAQRWAEHRSGLRNGKHHSRHMQAVWDKHGAGALEFAVLEPVADKATLIQREQVWLDKLSPAYNTAKVAGSPLGVKHSDDTRAKISAALMGNTNSLCHKHSGETRAKLSAALVGNTRSLGNKHSGETRARMSAGQKGRKYGPQTPAHIAARVAANTGKKHTPAQNAAKSARQKGKKKTPAHTAAAVAGRARARSLRNTTAGI